MGQVNQLEETLAVIRRKKKVLIKNLDLIGLSDEMKNNLKRDIEILSVEEKKILDQLKYDEAI